MGPQNEFPGITRTEGFCGNSTENPECGISQPIPILDFGVPIFSVLGEMKLICRAALTNFGIPVFGVPNFGISGFGIPGLGRVPECGFSLPSESLPPRIPVFGIPVFGIPTFGILVEFRHHFIRHPLDSTQLSPPTCSLCHFFVKEVPRFDRPISANFGYSRLTSSKNRPKFDSNSTEHQQISAKID